MKVLNYVLVFSVSFILASCNIASQSDFDRASKDLCECTGKQFDQISPEFKKDYIEASKKNLTLDQTLETIFNKRKDDGNDTKNLSDAVIMLQFPDKVQKCLEELKSKYKDLKTLDSESETIDKFMQAIEKQEDCDFLLAIMKTLKASTAQQ